MLAKLNSPFLYLICGGIILLVAVICILFAVRAYQMGKEMGIDPVKMKRVITASATFAVLPSVGILLGVIALSGSLGTPWPWLRLSVIGALHYETQVAEAAAESVGIGGLSIANMTEEAFTTIALLMSFCIMWGMILMIFNGKAYSSRLQGGAGKQGGSGKQGASGDGKTSVNPIDKSLHGAEDGSGEARPGGSGKQGASGDGKTSVNPIDKSLHGAEEAIGDGARKQGASGDGKTSVNPIDKSLHEGKEKNSAEKKKLNLSGFGDVAMTAMFIGLVSAYIASYIGGIISGNGRLTFSGSPLSLAVAVVAAIAMAIFIRIKEKTKADWVDSFSVAGSMLVAMAAAVFLGRLI